MTTPFEEQVVLITGSARRIGAEMVRAFHAAGARVCIHYHRSRDAARALASELEDTRANSVRLVRGRIGERRDARETINDAIQGWGRLDVLVNNASTYFPTPLDEVDEAAVKDLMDSNFTGPLFLCQAARPYLAQHAGRIVNMLDIQAEGAPSDHVAYAGAKAALAALTRVLARELAPDIRVNGIAPGTILWPESIADEDEAFRARARARIPFGREGTPADIAQAALYLAGDASAYVTGQILAVDGGQSLAGRPA